MITYGSLKCNFTEQIENWLQRFGYIFSSDRWSLLRMRFLNFISLIDINDLCDEGLSKYSLDESRQHCYLINWNNIWVKIKTKNHRIRLQCLESKPTDYLFSTNGKYATTTPTTTLTIRVRKKKGANSWRRRRRLGLGSRRLKNYMCKLKWKEKR